VEGDMSGKFCPVCERKNEIEALSCRFCGASLEYATTDHAPTTRRIVSETTDPAEIVEHDYIKSLAVPAHGIALYLPHHKQPIAILDHRDFVLGRRPEMGKEGFVDLIPFGGNEYGVSHRHALIHRKENRYEITDLDSTNGVFLNNKRIQPNKPYPLPNGSKVRLGLLVLYIVYKRVTDTTGPR
jgi:hypothetical protein